MHESRTISAPGKLMLFGEHAVVYNRPCLVTAIDQRMHLTAETIKAKEFQLEAPDVKITNYRKTFSELGKGTLPKGAQFVEIAVKNVMTRLSRDTGLRIKTQSAFSSQFGFGSSSASAVCVIKAVSLLFGYAFSQREIFDIAYETVLAVQGKGSGFDIAACVYGGTLYFETGGKKIEPLVTAPIPLIVGYSGIKADTVSLINYVKEETVKYPDIMYSIFDTITKLVELAKEAIEGSDWQKLGELMDYNQGLLEALGVSSRKLQNIIYSARSAGGYGGKLSGAGGGDCIITVAPNKKKKRVENAIKEAGGEVITVITNAQGVRLEEN